MKPARPPDEVEAPPREGDWVVQFGHVLKRLHRLISSNAMRGLQGELTEFDLSFSQMTALHFLRASGANSVTRISECTYLSLPAASHLVERLVRRGLAQRVENPDNRREKLVSLTEAGREVLSQMDSGFVGAYEATFARLRPEILHAATSALQVVLNELNLDELNLPGGPCAALTQENR